jgi:lysozyme
VIQRLLTLRLLACASLATTAASAVGVGCSTPKDDGQTAGAAISTEPTDGDAEPRKVCPSTRGPDGKWITVDGVDTADYQFSDWDRVVAHNPNIKYAFSRVSAGLVRVDSRFHYDWPAIKRVGLLRGAYQYFKPSQSAVAQADLFLRRIAEEGGMDAHDMPPVIDFETTNDMPAATVECRLKIWLARVENATGRIPLIYSSSVFNSFLGTELARYPLWVANYVQTPQRTCPRTPDSWDRWDFWQYGGAPVDGIYHNGSRDDDAGGSIALQDGGDGGAIDSENDVNFFDGTLAQLQAFVASTTSPGPVPLPPPLVNPPHVPGASPDAGGPVDCSDGCCIAAP